MGELWLLWLSLLAVLWLTVALHRSILPILWLSLLWLLGLWRLTILLLAVLGLCSLHWLNWLLRLGLSESGRLTRAVLISLFPSGL
ncbi:hypothetical protein KIMH_02380 [Bombiscardovia apis]|uniref:Uncharacterized protein n=1 Tax=Bombiscardovia apis TaxID=2932182 RepID=A0ABN6SFS5_9BIFI|nr:hypothetical protein KIMH_02380 [Bombiscardovia apis]